MLDSKLNTGEWIRSKRTNLGLTQQAFAELLDMSQVGERTVRGWEAGEHIPTHAKIAKIQSLPDTATLRSPFQSPEEAEFTFIDLFAGIGGIRYPFQKLGGHCVFTSEWDKFAKKTYAANFGELPFGDIVKII